MALTGYEYCRQKPCFVVNCEQGKIGFPFPRSFVPQNLASRDSFGRPVSRQSPQAPRLNYLLFVVVFLPLGVLIAQFIRRYFQHAHFIPIVGVGKRGEYYLVHGDLPRQHSFGTTLRFTGPVPADSRQ